MSDRLSKLQSVMETTVEDALTAVDNESEHRIWFAGEGVTTYVTCAESPPDRSVVLQEFPDGPKYRVSWQVRVDEIPEGE